MNGMRNIIVALLLSCLLGALVHTEGRLLLKDGAGRSEERGSSRRIDADSSNGGPPQLHSGRHLLEEVSFAEHGSNRQRVHGASLTKDQKAWGFLQDVLLTRNKADGHDIWAFINKQDGDNTHKNRHLLEEVAGPKHSADREQGHAQH